MFPSSYQRDIILVTWQKCSLVLQKKCDLVQLAETCPRFTREMLFDPHARSTLLVLQEKFYLSHNGRDMHLSQKSQYILRMADISQTHRCKLEVFLSSFYRANVRKQCYVCHISATLAQQIMLAGKRRPSCFFPGTTMPSKRSPGE